MQLNSEWPMASVTSALKNLLLTSIKDQKTAIKAFTVTHDHPENISDTGKPNLNLYPFLVNEAAHLRNVSRSEKQNTMQDSRFEIHFLLSATGDHTKLFPHMLLDSARKTIKATPVLALEECNFSLKITSQSLSIEASTMIWSALKCSHRINIVLRVETVD